MHWYAGTSGYSYKEWIGSFYPEGIKADAMLAYYAVHLPAVEINNTFYRMPRTQVLEGWADAVPNDFRFAIKASRRITHEHRLVDAGEATTYLARKLEALGEKLGVVLFQLPPYLKKDCERLRAFLDVVPSSIPAAFEFRDASWFDDETFDLLSSRGRALCVGEDDDLEEPSRCTTTDWVYLRLRRSEYSDASLLGHCRRAQATGAQRGFAFFKHEDAAAGPAIAARFLTLSRDQSRRAAPPRAAPKRSTGGRSSTTARRRSRS
jgi:uncharacterized protein YecE (DUF72 family)